MKSFAIKFPLGLPLVSRRNPAPKPVTFFPAIMKDVLVAVGVPLMVSVSLKL